MKSGITSLVKFVAGTALGATMGATIGMLMAPKSGAEMQADANAYINSVKAEGERAREDAEARMAQRFREQVNDPDAFSSKA